MKIKKLIEVIKNLKLKIYFMEKHIQKLQEDIDYYVNKDVIKTKELEKLRNDLSKKQDDFLYSKDRQYVIKKDIISLVYWINDETNYNIVICFYNREPIIIEYANKKEMKEEYEKILKQL